MCVQFVSQINVLIIIIVIKLNSIILSYTIFCYCTALYEIYNKIYKTDCGFTKLQKCVMVYCSCAFLIHWKELGFEKVILNIDS